MNRYRLLPIVRAYLIEHGAPKAAEYSGHFLLHNTAPNDTTCPNCHAAVSKAFEAPGIEGAPVMVISCEQCQCFTVWPK